VTAGEITALQTQALCEPPRPPRPLRWKKTRRRRERRDSL